MAGDTVDVKNQILVSTVLVSQLNWNSCGVLAKQNIMTDLLLNLTCPPTSFFRNDSSIWTSVLVNSTSSSEW